MGTPSNPESLSVTGHLDELRRRILVSLAGLAGGTALGLALAKPAIAFLKQPAGAMIREYLLIKPTEVIAVYLKVGLYCGALIASPLLVHQAWQFVKPAIPIGTKIRAGWWLAAAGLLFAAGTAFAYEVLAPQALVFLLGLSRELATPMINLNDYISFVLAVLLVGGLVFEIPVVAGLLTRIGLVQPDGLRKRRKEAFFALCVVAAVITPTTDAFNMLIFVLPMVALYELGIWVSWLLSRDRKTIAKDPYRENH